MRGKQLKCDQSCKTNFVCAVCESVCVCVQTKQHAKKSVSLFKIFSPPPFKMQKAQLTFAAYAPFTCKTPRSDRLIKPT